MRTALWDNLLNCKRCGKVFLRLVGTHCPQCSHQVQVAKHQLYQYAQDHPHESLVTMADTLGIAFADAEAALLEGGFGTTASTILLACARCGSPTPVSQRRGKLCALCALPVESAIQQAIEAKTAPDEPTSVTARSEGYGSQRGRQQSAKKPSAQPPAKQPSQLRTIRLTQMAEPDPETGPECKNPQRARGRHGFKRNL